MSLGVKGVIVCEKHVSVCGSSQPLYSGNSALVIRDVHQ